MKINKIKQKNLWKIQKTLKTAIIYKMILLKKPNKKQYFLGINKKIFFYNNKWHYYDETI